MHIHLLLVVFLDDLSIVVVYRPISLFHCFSFSVRRRVVKAISVVKSIVPSRIDAISISDRLNNVSAMPVHVSFGQRSHGQRYVSCLAGRVQGGRDTRIPSITSDSVVSVVHD